MKHKTGQPLTARESGVLSLLLAGASNKVVSTRLYISIRSTEDARRRCMLKSGSRNAVQLGVWAAKQGIA